MGKALKSGFCAGGGRAQGFSDFQTPGLPNIKKE
jgi:hypothetical protein